MRIMNLYFRVVMMTNLGEVEFETDPLDREQGKQIITSFLSHITNTYYLVNTIEDQALLPPEASPSRSSFTGASPNPSPGASTTSSPEPLSETSPESSPEPSAVL